VKAFWVKKGYHVTIPREPFSCEKGKGGARPWNTDGGREREVEKWVTIRKGSSERAKLNQFAGKGGCLGGAFAILCRWGTERILRGVSKDALSCSGGDRSLRLSWLRVQELGRAIKVKGGRELGTLWVYRGRKWCCEVV